MRQPCVIREMGLDMSEKNRNFALALRVRRNPGWIVARLWSIEDCLMV